MTDLTDSTARARGVQFRLNRDIYCVWPGERQPCATTFYYTRARPSAGQSQLHGKVPGFKLSLQNCCHQTSRSTLELKGKTIACTSPCPLLAPCKKPKHTALRRLRKEARPQMGFKRVPIACRKQAKQTSKASRQSEESQQSHKKHLSKDSSTSS